MSTFYFLQKSSLALYSHLVDAPERRDIDGLATDGAGATDAGGVLAGAGVDDGVHQHLQGVLKREEGMR